VSEQSYEARLLRHLYAGFVRLDLYEGIAKAGGKSVTLIREVHDHGHGAAVLPYDEARRTCLLVRQLRLPVHVAEGSGLISEAAAGLIDPGEEAAETARREAAEELGYRIHDLEEVATFYTIPGLVTERISCFLGRYTPADRIEGELDADEDELIEVEEWALPDLWRAFERGELRDGKAIVCLQALRIRRPDLFG
jgi:nudix-type nucleoside diphosphatase (YffH/AdpP family)